MSSLKISHPVALHFLLTDDLYCIKSDELIQDMVVGKASDESVEVVETDTFVVEQTNSIPKINEQIIEISKPIEVVKPEPAFFEYLGENNKYILILVNNPTQKVIDPKELETLANILKGKKQEIKDVALVNLNNYPSANFTDLKSYFACNSIILFGVNPAQLKIEGIQSNQITSFQGTKILATYSIAEMLGSVDKKRAFWDEMKKL